MLPARCHLRNRTPCCSPLLASVGGALGLGALQTTRGYMDYAMQTTVALALAGDVFAYRRHRRPGPMLVGVAAAGLVFLAYYGHYHVLLIDCCVFCSHGTVKCPPVQIDAV